MNRAEMISAAIDNVSCRRGAPMGRAAWHPEGTETHRCILFRLKFYDGAYDKGGAYWGSPANVWCLTDGENVRGFVRAPTRSKAWSQIKPRFPTARLIHGVQS